MGRKVLVAARGIDRRHSKKKSSSDKQKGARWAKGHSCVSNPKTTKHRELASNTFLHPVAGNSLLTVKNVNATRGLPEDDVNSDDENDTVLSSDIASLTISDGGMSVLTSASSVKSIASGWSQISHKAFERFLRKFRGDIVFQKDMLSILGAASEVIGEAGGKKNETEFFATFMSLLDSCPVDQYQPVMSLVCIVIGKVSPGVLKLRFGDIYPKIGAILPLAIENDDDPLIRTTIEALVKLLKVQDSINLEEHKPLEGIIYTVLKCALHSKPKVRRKTRILVQSLIATFNGKNNSTTVMPKLIIGWILDQLACYPMCDSRLVADALTLLVSCWNTINRISFIGAKKLYEGVLRVMSSGDAAIMKIGLSFFSSVFQSNITIVETSSKENANPEDSFVLNDKLLVALWELQPDSRNVDGFILWLSSVFLGIIRSQDANSKSKSSAMSYLPQLFDKISPVWLTNNGKKVVKVLKEFLPHIVTPEIESSIIDPCFQTLAKSYLIVPPNVNALQSTECLLESLSPANFTKSANEVFLQLISMNQSPGVHSVLGKFVKAFGVENLWNSAEPVVRWSIILPLLQDNLNDASIAFWKKEILVHIGKAPNVNLIWESFIGFCRNPKDPENFPAELVGKVIVDKLQVRLPTLAALRQFIEWGQCRTIAIKYSKNYLPLLFKYYVREKSDKSNPGHADSIGVTIQKYLSICEEELVNQLLEEAIGNLESAEIDLEPVYDLIAFISSNVTDAELQAKILTIIGDRFENPDDRKRIYRILSFLAKNENISEENLETIFKKLCESKLESKSNAAAIRLDCINEICKKNPQWHRNFLSEVILNLISANAKAKKCATKFVINYCNILKEEGKSMDDVVDVILAAFKSSSPLVVSTTTYFSFLIYKELKPASPNFAILSAVISNVRKIDDPVVWKYSLAFVNLCLSLYKGGMGPLASDIGALAGESKYPRREINKILARMIKVFGSAGLKAVLPNAEDPKMRVRVKNLCKKLKKLKEKSKSNTTTKNEDESDEEQEDEFGDIKNDAKPLVIKEGLVDFLNPREITQALINEVTPSTREENEFKESKDGKLIIGGNMEDDDDDDSLDSDMDLDDIEAARLARKRKSSGSVASTRKSSKTYMSKMSTKSTKSGKSPGKSRSVAGSSHKKNKKMHSSSTQSVKSKSRSHKSRKM